MRAEEQRELPTPEPHTRSSALIDGIPAVVWEAYGQPGDSQQRIDFVSPYVETMLGYSVEEWLSTANFWLSIVHPEDRERAAAAAATAFASGTPHVNRFRWKVTPDDRASHP